MLFVFQSVFVRDLIQENIISQEDVNDFTSANSLYGKSVSELILTKIPLKTLEQLINTYKNSPFIKQKKFDVEGFFKNGNHFYESAIESAKQVRKELKATQEALNLTKPFASIKINTTLAEPAVNIQYNYQNPNEIEEIVNTLINQYNDKINKLPSPYDQRNTEENELAIRSIAELFQNLEWLHPFFDGQGRTDLILLAKLLSENGFNPSILYQPYFSTFEPIENWISYLKEGIEAWKKESIDK